MYGDIKNAIDCEVADFLNGYVHPIVLFEVFRKVLNQVNMFRINIGKCISLKVIFKPHLSKLLNIDQGMTQERFVFNRLVSDYQYIKSLNYFKHNISKALSLKDDKFPKFPQEELLKALLKGIDRNVALVKDQYNTLDKGFKDYVATKNLQANYKLQKRIFWLTIILLFLSLIQALPDDAKKSIFSKLFNKAIGIKECCKPKDLEAKMNQEVDLINNGEHKGIK
jgi:hypothetical protein